ncbi:MAG TPA: glycosyltransferase [Thermoleophilaceae bacterium]|nr:glycosyltransferase [Thermoleophilaceae bacterium]
MSESVESPAAGAPILSVLARYPQISETFVEGELRELVARGVPVEVVALAPGVPDPGRPPVAPADYPAEHPPGERIRATVRLAHQRPGATAAFLARERAWPPPRGHRRLRGLARIAAWVPLARRARHLHAHFATEPTEIARLLAAFAGRPFSFAGHATDVFQEEDALRANLRSARFCVTDCDYNRRHIASVAPEHAHKVSVLILGADLERFRRARPYEPEGPVVAVGRLVPKKGFADLIAAAARREAGLDGREVLIVGDGPERARLERQIAESKAPVRLLGAQGNDSIRELLERAAIGVLPCVVAPDGDRDSMPVALKEAMALELPVIGTREVGLPELIDHDRGRLVAPADPVALALAIGELLGLPDGERIAMGRAGRAFVEAHCDQRRQADRLLRLIEGPEPTP